MEFLTFSYFVPYEQLFLILLHLFSLIHFQNLYFNTFEYSHIYCEATTVNHKNTRAQCIVHKSTMINDKYLNYDCKKSFEYFKH